MGLNFLLQRYGLKVKVMDKHLGTVEPAQQITFQPLCHARFSYDVDPCKQDYNMFS